MISIQYAGLKNVHQTGLSVAQCVSRLAKLAYAEERLFLLQAVHIVNVPEWDVKILLGRWQYEDSQHADQLKHRLTELRVSKKKAFTHGDKALQIVFDEAMYATSTVELVAAITCVFKPALLQAYKNYAAKTNGLADYPTLRLLKIAIAEEEEAVALLNTVYKTIVDTPEKEAEAMAWVKTLNNLLTAAGGIDGTGPLDDKILQPQRATTRYTVPRTLARDNTFATIWDFVHVENESVAERLAQIMATRLAEITAAESLAYVLWETTDQPWPFYIDISRHMWDEVRHTLFGEAATEDVFADRSVMPMREFDIESIMQMTPLEIYAMLGIGVEAALMKYPPGKREEFEFCRDTAKYPLMATLQDFDWADEVLHVNIARRQLNDWFAGSRAELLALAQKGVDLRASVRHKHPQYPLPSVDHKLAELEQN